MTYHNPKKRPESEKRESPQDFMKAYNKWQRETGQDQKKVQLTPKAFAILRGKKKHEEKDN